MVNNLPSNAGDARDVGLIPGLGRSPGGGHGNLLQYSCLKNPHGQRSLGEYSPQGHTESDMTEAIQHMYMHISRKNEETEPKQKQHLGVDVTGDGSKVQRCKEQYCIGTWNVRSMNQGKLEVVNRRWQQ